MLRCRADTVFIMQYLNLILMKALVPAWQTLGVSTAIVAVVGAAIFGENLSEQWQAWVVLSAVGGAFVSQLLMAPYRIWIDDQKVIADLKAPDRERLRAERRNFRNSVAAMLTEAQRIHTSWAAWDKVAQGYNYRGYQGARAVVSGHADRLIHLQEIYSAAQDAINRCDIVVADAADGHPSQDQLQEAREAVRVIVGLLSS